MYDVYFILFVKLKFYFHSIEFQPTASRANSTPTQHLWTTMQMTLSSVAVPFNLVDDAEQHRWNNFIITNWIEVNKFQLYCAHFFVFSMLCIYNCWKIRIKNMFYLYVNIAAGILLDIGKYFARGFMIPGVKSHSHLSPEFIHWWMLRSVVWNINLNVFVDTRFHSYNTIYQNIWQHYDQGEFIQYLIAIARHGGIYVIINIIKQCGLMHDVRNAWVNAKSLSAIYFFLYMLCIPFVWYGLMY